MPWLQATRIGMENKSTFSGVRDSMMEFFQRRRTSPGIAPELGACASPANRVRDFGDHL